MANRKSNVAGTARKHPKKAQPNAINPSHYQIEVQPIDKDTGKKLAPVRIQTVDLIEALFPNDAHMAHMMTYVTRIGRKGKSSYEEDANKARWWLKRALQFRGLKVED